MLPSPGGRWEAIKVTTVWSLLPIQEGGAEAAVLIALDQFGGLSSVGST
jgi:hypothetical protein